jgi:outer membrane lipoprotein-sorting protein
MERFLILLLLPLDLLGQNADSIMWKVYTRPTWNDMKGKLTLTLISPKGTERKREMEIWSYTDPKTDETKMLIIFVEPPDIRGTKFLIHEHKNRDDDMWFYLPALRKVKRIAAGGKAGSFMGSDFSNYDIGGGEYEDWSYKLLGDTLMKGVSLWIIESSPRSPEVVKKSGYSKVIKWVRKDNYIVVRSDYYDRAGELFKRIEVSEIKEIGGILFETRMIATNLDSGHKSEFRFREIEINTGLSPDIFTLRSLRR